LQELQELQEFRSCRSSGVPGVQELQNKGSIRLSFLLAVGGFPRSKFSTAVGSIFLIL
jgi:hypothetical protein